MKAYVSIDLEGLPGISSISQVAPKYSLYNDARQIMTRIARVVAESLLKCGFKEVVIADSHGFMANIMPWEMPRRVKLLQGYPRPYSMVVGLDRGFNAVLFIGYHAAAGTTNAFLDHTYSSSTIHRIWVNDEQASEYYVNALYASYYKVPLILVAGDKHLEDDVKRHTPWAVFLALKEGISRVSALYSSLDDVEEELKDAVKDACNRLKQGQVKLIELADTYKVRIELKNQIFADMLQVVPGIRRIDAYTVEYIAKTPVEVLGIIETAAWIGAGATYIIERGR